MGADQVLTAGGQSPIADDQHRVGTDGGRCL